MKTKITWFDRMMTAVTFAEANEPEFGKKFLATTGRKSEKGGKYAESDAVFTADLHRAGMKS